MIDVANARGLTGEAMRHLANVSDGIGTMSPAMEVRLAIGKLRRSADELERRLTESSSPRAQCDRLTDALQAVYEFATPRDRVDPEFAKKVARGERVNVPGRP